MVLIFYVFLYYFQIVHIKESLKTYFYCRYMIMSPSKILWALLTGLFGIMVCDGIRLTATDTSQTTELPGYSSGRWYSNNMYQTWSIETEDEGDSTIEIEFDMDIEYRHGWCYDKLNIYDGKTTAATYLGGFCGKSKENVLSSSGRNMYVVFISNDHDDCNRGFKLTYKQIPKEKEGRCRRLEDRQYSVDSSYISIAAICLIIFIYCKCKSNDHVTPIRINNQSPEQPNVWMTPVSQQRLQAVPVQNQPPLMLHFVTGNYQQNIKMNIDIIFFIIFCFLLNFHEGTWNTFCEGKRLIAKDYQQYVETPGYSFGTNYPSNMFETWSIVTADDNYKVSVMIETDIHLPCPTCCDYYGYDWLPVYDGTSSAADSLGKFCSRHDDLSLSSSGRSMYVLFRSNHVSEEKGFKLKYIQVPNEEETNIWKTVGIVLIVVVCIGIITSLTIVYCKYKSKTKCPLDRHNADQIQLQRYIPVPQQRLQAVPAHVLYPPSYQQAQPQYQQCLETPNGANGNLPGSTDAEGAE
ncbi:exoskeleton protein RP43-like [Argopecten irradians]|uniref:exoskeleton protein RP43-like n=1 Tax=Argopecten irradians TaxID=31199 RepID=UPI0037171481